MNIVILGTSDRLATLVTQLCERMGYFNEAAAFIEREAPQLILAAFPVAHALMHLAAKGTKDGALRATTGTGPDGPLEMDVSWCGYLTFIGGPHMGLRCEVVWESGSPVVRLGRYYVADDGAVQAVPPTYERN